MKTIFYLCAAIIGLAAQAVEFPLTGFRLYIVSRNGVVVSDILRGSSRLVRHTGTLREQFWASDRFVASCRISKNLPGEFLMQWQLKAQNGIPEGAFIELSCRAEPEWQILKTAQDDVFLLKTPEQNWLCRIEGALFPQLIRHGAETTLRWCYAYEAQYINTIHFVLKMEPAH